MVYVSLCTITITELSVEALSLWFMFQFAGLSSHKYVVTVSAYSILLKV